MSYMAKDIVSQDWDVAFISDDVWRDFIVKLNTCLKGKNTITIQKVQGNFPLHKIQYYTIYRILINNEEVIDAKIGREFFHDVSTIRIDGITFLDIDRLIHGAKQSIDDAEYAMRQARETLEDINPEKYAIKITADIRRIDEKIKRLESKRESTTDIKEIKKINKRIAENREVLDEIDAKSEHEMPTLWQEYMILQRDVDDLLKKQKDVQIKNTIRKRMLIDAAEDSKRMGKLKHALCEKCFNDDLLDIVHKAADIELSCKELLKHCSET